MSVCLPLSSSLPLSLPFFLFSLSLSLESRLALILQSTGLSFLSVCKSVFQAPRFFPSNIVTLWFLTSVSISWKISYSGSICFIFSYLLQLIIKKNHGDDQVPKHSQVRMGSLGRSHPVRHCQACATMCHCAWRGAFSCHTSGFVFGTLFNLFRSVSSLRHVWTCSAWERSPC